jgi:hypothetical protein
MEEGLNSCPSLFSKMQENIKVDNKSFKNKTNYKRLLTKVINENCVYGKVKNGLNLMTYW